MPRTKKVVYATDIKSIFIPETIDLLTTLDKKEVKQVDKYYYFLHQLYLRRVTDSRNTKNSYIKVHSKLLEDILTTRHACKITQYWIDQNVVERSSNYVPGTKSYGYRFTEDYRDIRSKKVAIQDYKFADKLERKRKERLLKIDLTIPQHAFINFNLQELLVDAKAAYTIAFAENSTKKGSQKKREKSFNKWNMAIHTIQHKEWFLTRDKTGKRVHLNWSNYPTKLRGTVYTDGGEQLVNLDIRCSQPLMLAILLKKHYSGNNTPTNVLEYINQCEKGSLYETLANAAGVAITDRKKYKRRFFKKVLYGRNSTAMLSAEWYVFSYLYPDVAEYVEQAKAENHKALSHALQRQESEIMIDSVFAGLAADYRPEHYFALPIHDCITVVKSNAEDIKHRILVAFQKHYVTPTLSEEALS